MPVTTTLFYLLDSPDLFENPTPITINDTTGIYTLKDESLTIELNSVCKNLADALEIVDCVLRSWIFESSTFGPYKKFRFALQRVEGLENTSEGLEVLPQSLEYEKDDKGILIVSWHKYPPFPTGRYTIDLEVAWERFYKSFIDLGEPIQSAAYYVLTLAEGSLNGRKNAAKLLNMDEPILRKIGELTSTRGSIYTARKSLSTSSEDLTRGEKLWLGARIQDIIVRMGLQSVGVMAEPLSLKSHPI